MILKNLPPDCQVAATSETSGSSWKMGKLGLMRGDLHPFLSTCLVKPSFSLGNQQPWYQVTALAVFYVTGSHCFTVSCILIICWYILCILFLMFNTLTCIQRISTLNIVCSHKLIYKSTCPFSMINFQFFLLQIVSLRPRRRSGAGGGMGRDWKEIWRAC